MEGSGKVSLPAETVKYRLEAEFPKNAKGPQCGEINEYIKGIEWPIDCVGTIHDDPATMCQPNKGEISSIIGSLVGKLAREKMKGDIEKKREKAKEDAKEDLRDKLKDKFKGLF
jgi:AsmA protein